jgi:hypothetical protein
VAEVIYKLVNADIISEKFILNAGNIAYRDLFRGMAECFGKNPPKIEAKLWMTKIGWRAEWLRSLVTGKAPLITRETARAAYQNYRYSNEKVVNALDFSFRSFQDTLQWTCNALIEKYGNQPSAGKTSVNYMTPK